MITKTHLCPICDRILSPEQYGQVIIVFNLYEKHKLSLEYLWDGVCSLCSPCFN